MVFAHAWGCDDAKVFDDAWVYGNARASGKARVTNPEVLVDTLTANNDVHTCSYYCERPECVKAQRDELRERLGEKA